MAAHVGHTDLYTHDSYALAQWLGVPEAEPVQTVAFVIDAIHFDCVQLQSQPRLHFGHSSGWLKLNFSGGAIWYVAIVWVGGVRSLHSRFDLRVNYGV